MVLKQEKHSSHTVVSMQASNEGRFAFTTAESGDHQICFKSNYSSWTSDVKTVRYAASFTALVS